MANPGISSGSVLLGGGAHSITIQMLASPFGSGAAFFRIDSAVPEPGTLLLLGLGFAGLGLTRRRTNLS